MPYLDSARRDDILLSEYNPVSGLDFCTRNRFYHLGIKLFIQMNGLSRDKRSAIFLYDSFTFIILNDADNRPLNICYHASGVCVSNYSQGLVNTSLVAQELNNTQRKKMLLRSVF